MTEISRYNFQDNLERFYLVHYRGRLQDVCYEQHCKPISNLYDLLNTKLYWANPLKFCYTPLKSLLSLRNRLRFVYPPKILYKVLLK